MMVTDLFYTIVIDCLVFFLKVKQRCMWVQKSLHVYLYYK